MAALSSKLNLLSPLRPAWELVGYPVGSRTANDYLHYEITPPLWRKLFDFENHNNNDSNDKGELKETWLSNDRDKSFT